MRGWLIGIMVALGVVLGTMALLFAQGAPTAPSVVVNSPLTPGTAQSEEFTLEVGFSSISAPNTVWGPGFHLTFSITQAATNGVSNVIVAHHVGSFTIASQSGSFYTMTDTETFNLPAVCSGSACAGVSENVTVVAVASVVTPYQAWFSPTTTALFDSSQTGCTVASPCAPSYSGGASPSSPPAATQVSSDTFLAELLVPLFALAGGEMLAAYAVVAKHPALAVAGIATLVFAFALYAVLVLA